MPPTTFQRDVTRCLYCGYNHYNLTFEPVNPMKPITFSVPPNSTGPKTAPTHIGYCPSTNNPEHIIYAWKDAP